MNIREIRRRLLLTQIEFAEALGMSLSAVQTWEEKGNMPSLKAQKKILELCKKNGINDLRFYII